MFWEWYSPEQLTPNVHIHPPTRAPSAVPNVSPLFADGPHALFLRRPVPTVLHNGRRG